MTKLTESQCEACRADAPQVTAAEQQQLLMEIPDWQIKPSDGVQQLVRHFSFPDFRQALAFTNKVGALAEAEQHHPSLLTTWGEVTVTWWTHKIKGLHRNDFIMAAKTDQLFQEMDEQ